MKAARIALTAIAVFVAVYVVYAHLASWRTAREYERESATESLATEHALHQSGALTYHMDGASLVVVGDTGSAPATLEWTAPPRRLGEILLAMRVRATSHDVVASIGLEDTRDGRRVAVAIHTGAKPIVALDGAASERAVPLERPETAHEITLRLSPELHLAAFAVDGVFVGSAAMSLDAGALVRTFHLVEAGAGEHVEVAIESVHVVGIPREADPVAFDERFEGQVIDPIRWRLLSADGWTAESHAMTSGGLVLDARALRGSGAAMAGIVGPTFSLRSFRATARVHVERAKHASMFFGVTNTHGGLPQWRAFDVGLLDGAEGMQPFSAGHWSRDGQNSLRVFPRTAGTDDVDAFIEYDAATGVGRAGLGASPLIEKPLDLEPLEDVQLHLGINLSGPDADARIVVGEVRFEPR
ncbi:MAG TPA: hypothetical protein VH054_11655 [Polyangiaceae bacterium]|nr:hypothetical protein [Polyangiaceae bacterium]